MVPWVGCPSLDVDLTKPFDERFEDVPLEAREKGKRILEAVLEEIPGPARFLADAARTRTRNRFHKEACALARTVDTSWRWIMLANISYDLAMALYGCSTMALPTPDGPVLARNMDWYPEDLLAQTSYLIRARRGGQLVYANAGWLGVIGVVTGLSARGFAVALNAVSCPEGYSTGGYPVLLHIRRVLEDAENFDSAVEMLANEHLVAPCLLTVVGTENLQRVVLERTPRRCAQRWGEDGQPLLTTNHYRLLFQGGGGGAPELDETTCMRYEAMSLLLADHDGHSTVGDAMLLYVLSDPGVIQDITAQHVVMRPRQQEIRMFVPRRFVEAAPEGVDDA
jgi:hypothetical protein